MVKEVTECRCCGRTELEEVLDLGDQPLANSYHHYGETLEMFPLKLNICKYCFHGQLSVVVDPEILFKNYLYVSGTTQTLKNYFDWFAREAVHTSQLSTGRVLDIACNDGSQLDSFKKLGWVTYGVDPAENLVPLAQEKGHMVTCAFWDKDVAKSFGVKFDIIVAQNVFAHTHDILGFLLACKEVMHDNTVLLIQTSQANMFSNNEFDTIYHEHLSFFNTLSMIHLVNRSGLHLQKVIKPDIHGTSYLFRIGIIRNYLNEQEIFDVLEEETLNGLYRIETYRQFAKNAVSCLSDLRDIVDHYQSQSKMVIGYGAAAKGMTVLNSGNIKLRAIIDDNPMKHGLYTPGTDIPIYNPNLIKKPVYNPITFLKEDFPRQNIVIVPLAWNFFNEIKKKVKNLRPTNKDTFVQYFPHLKISLNV